MLARKLAEPAKTILAEQAQAYGRKWAVAIEASMSIRATIMNSATGQPIQKHVFGRMPFIGTAFHLEIGERVATVSA